MTSDQPIKTADSKLSGTKPIQDTVEVRGNLGRGESAFTTFSDELESIYRYAPVGLCVLDTELRFQRINLRLAEINGIPVEDHIGRRVREIVPHLADQADQILTQILQTGEPLLDVEVTGITAAQPDAIRTWIESWLPLKRNDGTIIGVNVVAQEITARKQAEADLRQSERRLSLAISATADAIWEWNLTTNQTYYSPRWYAMLGYGVDEIPMDYDGWKRLCHPDDLRPTMEVIRSSLKSDNFYAAEFRMRSKDGGWKWILGRGRVVERDAAGEPLLLSGTNTDITDRKRAEEALRESEARLSAILNELPIGVGVYDSAGRPILVNDLMRQYTPESMPSRDPERRQRWHAVDSAGVPIPPDLWPGARALGGESVIPGMEFSHTDPNGREFWMMVSAVPFAGLKGGEIGAIAVVQDITELKEAERTLVETNRELNEYTYAVVHNLKAPFRAVQNYANFLLEDAADALEGEPKQFLDGIKKAVHYASQQFSDLDALYLIRKHTVDIEPVEMNALLGEFVAMYSHAADRQLAISAQWPVLRTDGFLLRQIFMALIDNGLKYNQSAVKRVDIGWQANADGIEISVQDDGIGIDPQYHEHIFHIFKRLHTEEEYEGTGIGLAIARRAVQRIGGELRVESAVGQGSTFVISLPAAMVEEGDRT